jgi:phosphoribosylformylglycinamidine synthase
VLVSIKSDQERAWQELLDAQRQGEQEALARPIGRVGAAGVSLSFEQACTCLLSLAVEELRISYENALPRRLAAAG